MNLLKAIEGQWQPQRDRILWVPVCFACGIALFFAFSGPWPAWVGLSAIVAALYLFGLFKFTAPRLTVFAGVLLLAAFGFLAAHVRSMTVHEPMLTQVINITRVEGRVLDVTVAADDALKGKKRVVMGDLVIDRLKPDETPYSIKLSSRHIPAEVKPGDRITVLARLMPPSGPIAPEGFDYRRQAYYERVGAVGFTLGKFAFIEAGESHADTWFSALRQTISRRIMAQTPDIEGAVATALLTGERSSIPESVNDTLRDAGIYHLLSISGLHVAIVCGFTFFVLRFLMALSPWLALHWPIKKIAAAAAIAVGVFYILLAGAPVPAQRSMLMTGLVLFAVMLDRAAISLRTLMIVALLVLAVRPESLVGASFQLSFAAVLAMVAFHESFGRGWLAEHWQQGAGYKVLAYFGGIAVTTLLASFATFPIVLHHFGRVQIYGILANAAAIPLTSFIVMPFGMLAMLAMPLGLEGPLLKIVAWGLTLKLDVAAWVAGLPHAAWSWPSLPLLPFLVSSAGFLFLCLWRGWLRWVGAVVMVFATLAGFYAPRPLLVIDAEGKHAAVSAGGQVVYLFKKPTRYVRSNWMALWGGEEWRDGKPLKNGVWEAGGVRVACDDWACRIEQEGARVSILRNANAASEECGWADLMIVLDRAFAYGPDQCKASVTSSYALRKGGGASVWLSVGKPRLEPMDRQ